MLMLAGSNRWNIDILADLGEVIPTTAYSGGYVGPVLMSNSVSHKGLRETMIWHTSYRPIIM